MEEIICYQIKRWRDAVDADARGETVVLDGDPFKLYYSWAAWRVGLVPDNEWRRTRADTRERFVAGDYGVADLVLFADPGLEELKRRKEHDQTRTRRNFEQSTRMRPFFIEWYQAVERLSPGRVLWQLPAARLDEVGLTIGPRPERSTPEQFDELLTMIDP